MNIHVAYQRNAWTAEQQTIALQMKAEGATYARIGAVVGRSKDAVKYFFHNQKRPKAERRIYPWAGERGERAIAMWKEGFSGTQIAEALGNVTRSAVIAWLNRGGHRLGFAERVRRQSHRASPRPKAPAYCEPAKVRFVPPAVEILPEPVAVIAEPLLLTIEQTRDGQCKYICAGTGDEALYCGHPVHKSGSWCAGHRRVVFWEDAPAMKPSKHAWWGQ